MIKKKNFIFFVDPMSYENLEEYDLNVLSEVEFESLLFLGNMKMIKSDKLNSKLIYNYSDKKGVIKFLSYLTSQFSLIILFFKHRPKVVHFQWLKQPVLDYLVIKVFKLIKRDVKIVFTAHNILPHNSGRKYLKIFKKIYNFIDKIIVHDKNSKNRLQKMFLLEIDKIEVIKHGILSIDRNEYIVNNLLREHNFENQIVFSFLGNLSDYKGVDLIIKTWNDYIELNRNNKIKLIVAGRGDCKGLETIKNYDNVLIVNKFLTNDEFISYLKLSDVVLLPYKEISQSGILLTTLNENKLVIVSNTGGLTEPFEIANVGWILDPLTETSLKDTIIKASKLKKKKEYISRLDKKKLKNFYSWKNISNTTNELYLNLCNE